MCLEEACIMLYYVRSVPMNTSCVTPFSCHIARSDRRCCLWQLYPVCRGASVVEWLSVWSWPRPGVLQGASGVTASPPVSVCPPCACACPPFPPTTAEDPDMAPDEFNDLTQHRFFG